MPSIFISIVGAVLLAVALLGVRVAVLVVVTDMIGAVLSGGFSYRSVCCWI